MRPHTRTQCNDGKDCVECGQGSLSAASQPSSSSTENANETANGVTAAINHRNVTVAGNVDSTNTPQDKTEKRLVVVSCFDFEHTMLFKYP